VESAPNQGPRRAAESEPPALSVVIPVRNRPNEIVECVAAVRRAAAGGAAEIVVVDDASSDETPERIARLGVSLLRMEEPAGPAAARNAGAAHARSALLLFVDSDVLLHADAIEKLRARLAENEEVDAWFGSYDASPRAPGLVSQYRNLLHHYTHQHAAREASTFWAGCGAVRRAAFEDVGGFDEGRYAHAIEDIELGTRLVAAGYRIRVDPSIQGTHLKRWTLVSMVKTDVWGRAIPWARLILSRGDLPDDLNVSQRQRLCVAATGVGMLAALGAPWSGWAGVTALASLGLVLVLNLDWLRFLARVRGLGFALGAVPLQLLYHFYSGASFGYAWIERALGLGPPPD
jgi:GT2 family glycosyltransferase